jgi:hypothetical protein
MSWEILQPIVSETAAAKANKGGDDLTNPATWRTNLDVPSNLEARRRGLQEVSGVFFDNGLTTKVVSRLTSANAIGTSPFSIWLRFVVPQQAAVSSTFGSGLFGITSLATGGGNANDFEARIETGSLCSIYFRANGSNNLANATRWNFSLVGFEGQLVDMVVTRNATTISAFLNGNSVTVTQATAGTDGFAHAADSLNGLFYHTGGFSINASSLNERIYRSVLFNRALSLSDVSDLLANGIAPADQWGTTTASYVSSFTAGVDSWVGINSAATRNAGPVGSPGRTNVLQNVPDVTTATHGCQRPSVFSVGKRHRISGSVFVPTGQTNLTQVEIQDTGSNIIVNGALITPNAAWQTFNVEFIARGITVVIYGKNAGNYSYAGNGTDLFYLEGLNITRVGAVVDLDFTTGIGLFFPDRSTNLCSGEGDGGLTHTLTREYGQITIVKDLIHSDISSTAGTTKLLDLPANCGIVHVEFDRLSAFDGGITLEVGTAATSTKFAALLGSSTGIIGAASSSLNSESNSALSPVHIRKSGATTVGRVRARVTYSIRG